MIQSYAHVVKNGLPKLQQVDEDGACKQSKIPINNCPPVQDQNTNVFGNSVPVREALPLRNLTSGPPTFIPRRTMPLMKFNSATPFSRKAQKPEADIKPQLVQVLTHIKTNRENGNGDAASPLDTLNTLQPILDNMPAGGDAPHIPSEYTTPSFDLTEPESRPGRKIVGSKDLSALGNRAGFPSLHHSRFNNDEQYSRKVFVGGLPLNMTRGEFVHSFLRFGNLVVDWPFRPEGKSIRYRYAFIFFQDEISVRRLVDSCIRDYGKYFLRVSAPNGEYITMQVNTWRLNDADYIKHNMPVDPRKTVLVGGVPRTIKATELATVLDNIYGGVACVRIDVDYAYRYPKGIAFVSFTNQESYISALLARFIYLRHDGFDKRVEVKHCVVDNQKCDLCNGERCEGKCAQFFCANVNCLKYYCHDCWSDNHSNPGGELHKPLVKECFGPQLIPWRWYFEPRY